LLALVATVSIKKALFEERDRLPSMVNSVQSIHRQFLTFLGFKRPFLSANPDDISRSQPEGLIGAKPLSANKRAIRTAQIG
jgi:hypothetical protein